jgi:hypothetical protein
MIATVNIPWDWRDRWWLISSSSFIKLVRRFISRQAAIQKERENEKNAEERKGTVTDLKNRESNQSAFGFEG